MVISRKIIVFTSAPFVGKATIRRVMFGSTLSRFTFRGNSPISVIFVTGHSTERTVFLTTTQPTTVRTRFNILFSANCDPSSLYRYIKKESGLFVCTLCGKSSSQRGNLRKHVEGVHFPGQFVYECQTCGKKFNGMNSFSVHKYTVHGR